LNFLSFYYRSIWARNFLWLLLRFRSLLWWIRSYRSMNWNINNDSFIFFGNFSLFWFWCISHRCLVFDWLLFYNNLFSLNLRSNIWFGYIFDLIHDIRFCFLNFWLNRWSRNILILTWNSHKILALTLYLTLFFILFKFFFNISYFFIKRLTIFNHFLSSISFLLVQIMHLTC